MTNNLLFNVTCFSPNMCASMDVLDEKGLVVKSFYSECANYAPAQVCGLDAWVAFTCNYLV